MKDCLLFHFTLKQTGTAPAVFTVRDYGANRQTTESEFWNIMPIKYSSDKQQCST
jgi:hypothetical protein